MFDRQDFAESSDFTVMLGNQREVERMDSLTVGNGILSPAMVME